MPVKGPDHAYRFFIVSSNSFKHSTGSIDEIVPASVEISIKYKISALKIDSLASSFTVKIKLVITYMI